jgi:16S rRNA (guanine527-N7)-methyltransferase
MTNYLRDGLITIGFSSEKIEPLASKIEQYVDELYMFNKAYDLCGADTKQDIIIKHVLDSICAAPHIEQLANEMQEIKNQIESSDSSSKNSKIIIADIGSGGGLPGIPLAIALSNFNFVLVERMSKRCSFLENCIAMLGLTNVTVQNDQAERITQESFDIAVFRAFRPLDKKMTKVLLRILKKPYGKLVAYKARSEKIKLEMDSIAQWVPDYTVIPLSVPFMPERERNLVIINTKA